MEERIREEEDSAALEKEFRLLEWAVRGEEIVIRDDLYSFSWLLDAIRTCRNRDGRFRLIDSGCFDQFQLEWLISAGADLYTSDAVRPDFQQLGFLNRTAQEAKSFVACLFQGDLDKIELLQLARGGVFLHLTNREQGRDFSKLSLLARECSAGGSWLVFYHHGDLQDGLRYLAEAGSWLHVSETSLTVQAGFQLLLDLTGRVRSRGGNLIFHVEEGRDYSLLKDLAKAGAFLIFRSPLVDYRSPLRALIELMQERKLDSRTFYLSPTFLP